MASASPKLLVVANNDDASDVLAVLAAAGMAADLGNGGDETLELFESSEPDVVVIVAGLEEGDLSSLTFAMSSGSYGRPAPIVLIASTGDAVQSADDAKSVQFDRFVGRPLDPAFLVEAVMESSHKASSARLEAAMAVAIEEFVADAMGSLSAELTMKPAELTMTPARSSVAEAPEEMAVQPQNVEEPKPPSEVDATPASWRETTQVLSDGGSNQPVLDQESQELLDQVLRGDTEDEEVGFEVTGESDHQNTMAHGPGGSDSDEELGPSGSDFARQLREKMSAMAERLFPGQSSPDNAVNITPPSSAHTEIDLGSIVDEEDEAEDSVGASTKAMVSESEITMARGSETGVTTGAAHVGQALVGQLGSHDNDIAAVLAHFWSSGFTGILVLRREGDEKRVHFEEGAVVFASSGADDDRMSDLLVREGKVNQQQLRECRELVASSGRRMGEVLVDKGYLKPRELLPAVRQHLEDIFYSLFAWTVGSYDALPEQSVDERIRLSRHPAALIVEGVRRKYDRERLELCLGSVDSLVVVTDDQKLTIIAGATDLSVGEQAAYKLFDGEHALDEIAKECAIDSLRVAQLAHALICLNVAELVDGGMDEPARSAQGHTHFVGETDLEIDRQRVLAKYKLVQTGDYFQLLGVRLDASAFEIRRAYEAAQRHFSVDGFPDVLQEELGPMLAEIIEVIEEAFLVLSRDEVRMSYRANLQ